MHQRNAEQRNSKRKTNLILVSYFSSRSSLKPRPKPSQSVRPENLKCAICSQNEKSEKQKKHKQYPQKASGYFKDEIYTWIADLNTPPPPPWKFAADLYCHEKYHKNYTGK